MDDIVFNLLLTSGFGLSLPGTLRYRFTDLDAVAAGGDVTAVLAELHEGVGVEVAVFQLAGTLSVPLLTGLSPVPLTGIALGTAAGPVVTVLSGTDPARVLRLQFNLLDFQHIGGGLIWRPGQMGQLVFGMLGTQLPFGLSEQGLAQEQGRGQV